MNLLSAVSLLALPCAAQEGWKKLPPIPDPLGVAAPFAGVSNGALVVAGGANFPDKMPWEGGKKVWHDKVWVLEKPGGTWRDAGKLPRALAYGVSLNVGGTVVCIGGSDSVRHYADTTIVYWLEGKLGTRSQIASGPLPVPLAHAAGAVTARDVVYVACGSMEPDAKVASRRVFRAGWRDKEPAWLELPPLPGEGRILPVAAAHGEDFYLFSGAALEEKDGKVVRRYLRDAWRYSDAEGWKRLADLPRACVAAASPAPVVMDGTPRVLLMAGDDGTAVGVDPQKHPGFPATVLSYDIAANAWSESGKTPAPRATVPCVKWGEAFILPSGEVRPGVRSPEVWSWTK